MKKWFKIFPLYLLFGLLIYYNSLNNKFIIDDYFIISNPVLSETRFMFSQWDPYREQRLGVLDSYESLTYYRPMAHMVLDFNYAHFKNNYWKYHLFNIVLFVFASLLIYLLVEKLTGNHYLALLAGLFYLIHPVNGIVVNYISGCVFTFQVIFTLGTIMLLLKSLERNNDRLLYLLSLLLSFLSYFWNESGIMTPFYISAVIFLFRKDLLKDKAFYLLPYFLINFIYLVFRLNFLGVNESILKKITLFHMTFPEYLSALFQILSWYITRLFYPQGIVMKWATPILHHYIIFYTVGLGILMVLFFLFFIKFSKDKACQLGLSWILIGFAPVIAAAFRKPEIGAIIEPHWFVFASIGFFILVAHYFLILLDKNKKIGFILLFVLVLAWGTVSRAYNQLWVDQKTYTTYWSQQVPNLKSTYLYLAEADMREGDLKDSRKYCKMALSGGISDQSIYMDLGVIDKAEGHFKNAESDYFMSLQLNPYSARAYNNLACLYLAEGQLDKARVYFKRALMFNSLLKNPVIGLAAIDLKNEETAKAAALKLK